jgi:zinc protease
VQSALFPRHPYRRPVIGYADTLKALRVSEMRDYYERFYHPGNAVLVVSGDFEPARALELVQRHLGSIPAGRPYAQADAFRAPAEPQRGEQRLTLRWDDAGSRLCIAWPTVALGTDEDCILDLVSTLMAGGRLSRLYRRLVIEERCATSISVHNDTRVESGCFWLFAECAQGTRPEQLEQRVDAELARFSAQPVGRAELARAKRIIAAGEAHDAESISDLAEDLGEFAIDADWRLALRTLKRIQRTSAEELRVASAKLLAPGRRVVGWCLPRQEPARARKRRPR